MAEREFRNLAPDDRRSAIGFAERGGRHKAHLPMKDVRVGAAPGVVFEAPFADT